MCIFLDKQIFSVHPGRFWGVEAGRGPDRHGEGRDLQRGPVLHCLCRGQKWVGWCSWRVNRSSCEHFWKSETIVMSKSLLRNGHQPSYYPAGVWKMERKKRLLFHHALSPVSKGERALRSERSKCFCASPHTVIVLNETRIDARPNSHHYSDNL